MTERADSFAEPEDIPTNVTAIRDRDGSRLTRNGETPNIWWAEWEDNYYMTTDELWFPVTRDDREATR